MAIAEPKTPNAANSSKYVDFDEFIEFQLKKTRTGIHHTDLLSAGVVLAVALLGYLLFFTLFDHWIIPGGFGYTARLVMLGGVALLTGGWIVWKIVLPYLRQVNALYAAREIEQTYPDLKSSLLSWVDLRRAGRPVSPQILKALEKRTALQMSHSDVDRAVDRRFLMRSSYVLLAIVAAICIYTLASPKKMSNSIWRALLPAAEVAVATRTSILEVKPGTTEVLAREQIDVTAELGGVIPEKVTLLFTTSDRRFVDEPVEMRNTGEGLPRFRARLVGDDGAGLMKDLTYRVVAGDAESTTYHIRVNQPPTASVTEVAYDYPKYMGLDPTAQQGSTIDAWEGTTVTLRAVSNMPVKRAVVYLTDTERIEATAESQEMKVRDDGLEASWRLKFRNDGTFARHYHVQVWNERDQRDPQPTIHRLKIRPDLPPQIKLIHPARDLEAPANGVVPIAFEALDPDFQLRRVSLKLERSGELLPLSPRLFEGPPDRAEFKTVHRLKLEPFGLEPGAQLVFFVEAEDNLEPFANRGKNITRTSRVTITITEPKQPEELQEFDDRQQDQLDEKLEQDENRENEQPQERMEPPEDSAPMDDPQDAGEGEDQGQDRGPGEEGERRPSEEPMPGQGQEPDDRRDRPRDQQPQDQDEAGEGGAESTGEGDPQQGTPQHGEEMADGQSPQEQQPGGSDPADGTGAEQQPGETSPRDKAADDEALRKLLERFSQEQDQPRQNDPPDSTEQQERPEQTEQPERTQGDDEKGMDRSQDQPDKSATDSEQAPAESETPDESGRGEAPQADDMTSEGAAPPDQRGADDPSAPQPSPSGEKQEPGDQQQPGGGSGEKSDTSDESAPDAADDSSSSSPGDRESPDSTGKSSGEPADSRPAEPGEGADKPEVDPAEPSMNRESTGEGEPAVDRTDEERPQSGDPGQEPADGERSPKQGDSGEKPEQAGDSSQPPAGEPTPSSDPTPEGRSDSNDPPTPQEGAPPSGSKPDPGEGEKGRGSSDPAGPQESRPGEPQQSKDPLDRSGNPDNGDPSQEGTPGDAQPSQQNPSGDSPEGGGPGDPAMDSRQGESPPQTGDAGDAGDADSPQPPGADDPAGDSPQQGAGEEQGQKAPGQEQGGQEKGQEQGGQQGDAGGGDSDGPRDPNEAAGQPSGGDPGTPSGSGGTEGGEAPTPGSGGEGDAGTLPPEKADLANRKKATELALKKLRDQLSRGETPSELMEELGYTEQDLENFMQRLDERLADPGLDQSPESEAARRQFESLLQGIDYRSQGEFRGGGDRERRASQSFGTSDRPVPPEYREGGKAYQKHFSRQGTEK